MFSSLAISVALLAPAAPMPKDTTANPSSPAPQVVYFNTSRAPFAAAGANVPPPPMSVLNLTTYETKKVEVVKAVVTNVNGKNKVEHVKQEVNQRVPTSKPLGDRDEVFATADGSKLSKDEAIRRLSAGAVALVSMDGKPLDAGWLRVVDRDTITIHASDIKGQVSAGYSRVVKTPAPRLALVTPDADGKIRLATAEMQPNQAMPGNGVVFGNGKVVVQANIVVNGVPVDLNNGTGKPAKADEKKPLEEINFEAYTAGGDTVSKSEALKRLKAGGIVAIAGSNQKPDETFLKTFASDLLVLVSAELAQGGNGMSSTGVFQGGNFRIQVKPQIVPLPAVDPKEDAAPAEEAKPVNGKNSK